MLLRLVTFPINYSQGGYLQRNIFIMNAVEDWNMWS